jgi:hypothetical protein
MFSTNLYPLTHELQESESLKLQSLQGDIQVL